MYLRTILCGLILSACMPALGAECLIHYDPYSSTDFHDQSVEYQVEENELVSQSHFFQVRGQYLRCHYQLQSPVEANVNLDRPRNFGAPTITVESFPVEGGYRYDSRYNERVFTTGTRNTGVVKLSFDIEVTGRIAEFVCEGRIKFPLEMGSFAPQVPMHERSRNWNPPSFENVRESMLEIIPGIEADCKDIARPSI